MNFAFFVFCSFSLSQAENLKDSLWHIYAAESLEKTPPKDWRYVTPKYSCYNPLRYMGLKKTIKPSP